MHHFYVYVMSSQSRVLYAGFTNNIYHRVWEHQHDELPGFTSKYRVHRLVYFERFQYVRNAIARECRNPRTAGVSDVSWNISTSDCFEGIGRYRLRRKQIFATLDCITTLADRSE